MFLHFFLSPCYFVSHPRSHLIYLSSLVYHTAPILTLSTMEHESPDWERTPSVEIEMKDEPVEPPQIKAKTETSSTKDIKFEDAKTEEDSPSLSTLPCLPVSSLPDNSTPPAKAPPVSHTSYRNLSTRTTSPAKPKSTILPSAAAPAKLTPTTSSTSSEDPIILTTNVPILPKARPGYPPLNTTWVAHPAPTHHEPHPQRAAHTDLSGGHRPTSSTQWAHPTFQLLQRHQTLPQPYHTPYTTTIAPF